MKKGFHQLIFRSESALFLTLPALLVLVLNIEAPAQGSWVSTRGPFGGQIYSLAINSDGDVFAGGRYDVLSRLANNASSWTGVNIGLSGFTVYAIAINNVSGDIFVCGSTDINDRTGFVFRSTDNGRSWSNTGLTSSAVYSVAINGDGHIFVGTVNSGVFRSIDDGRSWVNTGLTNIRVNSLAINPSGHIFAGTNGRGVFRSTDNGNSWVEINTGLTNTYVYSLVSDSKGRIFAGTSDELYRNGAVFLSDDNGKNWRQVGFLSHRVYALAANTGDHIFAGTDGIGAGGIYRSTDNGASWVHIGWAAPNPSSVISVFAIAVNAQGYIFTGTFNGEVFRSVVSTTIPVATTDLATNVNITSAMLNGKVNPSGLSTNVEFEYGTSINYGNVVTAIQSPVIGTNTVPVSAAIENLSPGTTYLFRVVATNNTGKVNGINQTFRTLGPGIISVTATNITSTSAKLNGTVNPNGLNTTVKFEYGITTNYDSSVTTMPNPITGTSPVSVSAAIMNLTPGTTYHYRMVATNSEVKVNSMDQTFKTLGATVTSLPATNINSTSAKFNGIVNPNGLTTTVKFEYGTTTNYDNTVTATPSPITGTNQVSVSSIVPKLSPGTTYHYRVVATNSDGISNGADQSFMTSGTVPEVTTNTATSITPTSATLNGTVNPNGVSTAVKFQYGTTIDYGSEIAATESPVNGTNSISVSAVLNTLSPGTLYHYRVVATNRDTTVYGADRTFPTKGALPSVNTAGATKIDSIFAVLNGTVNPHGLSTNVIFEYGTTINYGNTVTATQSPANGVDSISINALVTNLSPGTTYHFRVVANNIVGKTVGADQTFITYVSRFQLNTVVSFPDRSNASDYQATDYRIVGLPGASDQSVKKFLSGKQNEDWQVYWDNGNSLIEFKEEREEFKFSAGRAFWIIKKGPLTISNIFVPSVRLNSAQEVEIPLPHYGWNLITNPFASSIAWSKVQVVNDSISQPIYSFNGGYSTPTSFDPYIGYYFYNDPKNSRPSLKIPYALLFSGSSAAGYVDPVKWRVNITLSSGDFVEKITSFGVATDANAGLDRLDFRKPRAIAAAPTVEFKRPQWDANYSIFATDIRPEFDDSESWEFDVRATSRQPAQLTFTGIERIPAHFEVYLIDEGRAQSVNLREDSLYHFTPAAELAKFKVVVGKKEKVQEQISSLTLPQEFALGQNYPNPFNPTTTIPVAIPAASEIKLQVYNLLGAEVKTLYDGSIEAGRYWFNWDGRNELGSQVATGVYLYRLTTNKGVVLVDKMILLR